MPSHVFGKSIDYRFTPLVNNEPGKASNLVSARIFSEAPSETQKDTPATAGFLQEVTTWKDLGGYEKQITFSALTDPEPHGGSQYRRYYVVVNFKYEAAGPTVFAEEVIDVYKPDALTSRISTQFPDVLRVEPKLSDYFTPGDLDGFIAEAKEDIFRNLEGRGYEMKRLFSLEKLNTACKYRAAALACMSLYSDEAPHWLQKFNLRIAQFEQALSLTQVGYDIAGTDKPLPDESTSRPGVAYILR